MADVTPSVLWIEHAVPDYESWKREGFDRDPIGRELRPIGAPRTV